jgi:2-methylcitrate dehydratase PrpD
MPMSSDPTLAQKQGDWVAALRYEDLPPEVIASAKHCLLDFLGVALRGSTFPQVAPARALLEALGGNPVATVIGGQRTSLPYAALANGTYGHSCEFDDCSFHCGHPGVCVIPAALATGEQEGIDGKTLITAIVAGYQAMTWSVGPIHRRSLDLGWHGTKVGGVFGAAAATGKILNLSPLQLANALAVAASDASGTMEYDQSGGEIKRFHAGLASRSGVEAALLAAAGLTGPLTIFEGKRGIFRLFSEGKDPTIERYWQGDFYILKTMFKLHPCAGTLHAAIDCVAKIQREHGVKADDVISIEVGLVDWAIPHGAAIVLPTDAISAQFSLAFSLGLQMVSGAAAIDDYLNPEKWSDEHIQAVARKVRPVADAVPEGAEGLFARVTLTTVDGAVHEASQTAPRGFPTLPASAEDLKAKFRSVTATIMPTEKVEALIAAVDQLHEQPDLRFVIEAFESMG